MPISADHTADQIVPSLGQSGNDNEVVVLNAEGEVDQLARVVLVSWRGSASPNRVRTCCGEVIVRHLAEAYGDVAADLELLDVPRLLAGPDYPQLTCHVRQSALSSRHRWGGRSQGRQCQLLPVYSHSIVPGGLLVTSSTTRLTSSTSLVIRVEILASTS